MKHRNLKPRNRVVRLPSCLFVCLLVKFDRGNRAAIASTAATTRRAHRHLTYLPACLSARLVKLGEEGKTPDGAVDASVRRVWSHRIRPCLPSPAAAVGRVLPIPCLRAAAAAGQPGGDGYGDGGRRGAGAGGGGRAVLRGGRGDAGRGQGAEHVRQRLRRHGRGHGRARAACRRRPLQPAPTLRPRRRRTPPRPHRPRIGADAEHAVEGIPGRQHPPAGPDVHRGEAVRDPAAGVHQGQRLPRQQRRRAGLRLQDHRQLPRRRLRRLPRRLRHRHRQDRPAVQRGERAAGEELVQRHRQPRHRLRLRRRARRHPRRDAFPAMTRSYAPVLIPSSRRLQFCCSFCLSCPES